jgi:hypothetical protein
VIARPPWEPIRHGAANNKSPTQTRSVDQEAPCEFVTHGFDARRDRLVLFIGLGLDYLGT